MLPNFPKIDLNIPSKSASACFAMNCFWSPDARFGAMPGVIRTRVGYAGGTTDHPTYRDIGDYIETIQFDYDPTVLDYADLLEVFWQKHNAAAVHMKRQYVSAIFYDDDTQKNAAAASVKTQGINIELLPADTFHLAEDYHQKYRLRQDARLFLEFAAMYPDEKDFMNSTAAARVNGYLGGFGTPEQLQSELSLLGLSEEGRAWLELIVKQYAES